MQDGYSPSRMISRVTKVSVLKQDLLTACLAMMKGQGSLALQKGERKNRGGGEEEEGKKGERRGTNKGHLAFEPPSGLGSRLPPGLPWNCRPQGSWGTE